MKHATRLKARSPEIHEYRELHAMAGDAHLWAELSQSVATPKNITLRIDSSAFASGGAVDGGAYWEVQDPAGIRALGEMLVDLASRAEKMGMFDALRAQVDEERAAFLTRATEKRAS